MSYPEVPIRFGRSRTTGRGEAGFAARLTTACNVR